MHVNVNTDDVRSEQDVKAKHWNFEYKNQRIYGLNCHAKNKPQIKLISKQPSLNPLI